MSFTEAKRGKRDVINTEAMGWDGTWDGWVCIDLLLSAPPLRPPPPAFSAAKRPRRRPKLAVAHEATGGPYSMAMRCATLAAKAMDTWRSSTTPTSTTHAHSPICHDNISTTLAATLPSHLPTYLPTYLVDKYLTTYPPSAPTRHTPFPPNAPRILTVSVVPPFFLLALFFFFSLVGAETCAQPGGQEA
ncbi:hypothetical protein L249_2851 [Ophiocordyceps polyrhachis-furcata BCC 54312]|uniref:Uncharacterized protein n=1 Tax=Ophiocordyceps polyrhachis-furcata BCC 54312 TaxID=1330021 RepID=A0A367LSP3_9HYPO|nr:hypothetical protein L249_2851 [Ophiocordyceps polyrhachis-furcata BCC 54312]